MQVIPPERRLPHKGLIRIDCVDCLRIEPLNLITACDRYHHRETMIVLRSSFRLLLALPALAWSGWFLVKAFNRWSYAGWYASNFPFIYLENLPRHLRATDWQTPLLMSTLPLAALGVWCLLRGIRTLKTSRAA